jgi:hypothetical protein
MWLQPNLHFFNASNEFDVNEKDAVEFCLFVFGLLITFKGGTRGVEEG